MCFQGSDPASQSIFPGNTVPASGIVRGDRAALSTIFASLDRPNVLEGAFGRDGARILSAHPALLAHWSVLNAFTWEFHAETLSWIGTVQDRAAKGCWISDSESPSSGGARSLPLSEGFWKIEITARGGIFIGKIDTDPTDALITRTRLHEAALTAIRDESAPSEKAKSNLPLDLDCAVLHLAHGETLTCFNFGPHLAQLSNFLKPLADFPLAGPGWLEEKFRFEMPGFQMEHHGEVKTLDLSVSFRYKSALPSLPDFRIFEQEIKEFLTSYPNDVDYWEILNRKLGKQLLESHSNLEELAITIAVRANDTIGFERASTVAMSREHSSAKDTI